jgi:hypothetical protein
VGNSTTEDEDDTLVPGVLGSAADESVMDGVEAVEVHMVHA